MTHIELTLAEVRADRDRANALIESLEQYLHGAQTSPGPEPTVKRVRESNGTLRRIPADAVSKAPFQAAGAKGLAVTSMVRQVVSGWASEFLMMPTLQDALLSRWPDQADKIKSGLSPAVRFLKSHGELKELRREGKLKIYLVKTSRLLVPGAGEKLLQEIHAEIARKNPSNADA